ncbi:MAG: hypothetical protein RLZZ15_2645, partial [Verrucomicrobiota bacterium]
MNRRTLFPVSLAGFQRRQPQPCATRIRDSSDAIFRRATKAATVLKFGASAVLAIFFLTGSSAFAELQWYGDPAKGRAVFDNLNFEGAERHSPGTGTILPATDPVHGPIWRVHKPAADKRAEIRGAKDWSFHEGKGGVMQQGVTYFIGWRYKFTLSEI